MSKTRQELLEEELVQARTEYQNLLNLERFTDQDYVSAHTMKILAQKEKLIAIRRELDSLIIDSYPIRKRSLFGARDHVQKALS